jgi:hypothetical protein
MTSSLKDFEWLDVQAANALLARRFSEGPYEQALAGGKLLRCLALPPEQLREVRLALQELFARPGTVGAVEAALESCLDELEEAWAALRRRFPDGDAEETGADSLEEAEFEAPGIEADTATFIVSLLLLRDDVEALLDAVALGWLSPRASDRERLNLLRLSVSSSARAFDERIAPYGAELRRELVGVTIPRELLDRVWALGNPWWLEMVDPELARLYRPRQGAEEKAQPLAAATKATRETWELKVEGRGHLLLYRDAAGTIRGVLEGLRGAEPGKPVELVWFLREEDREHIASFSERRVRGALEAELDESALEAEIIALRQGGRLWAVSH